MRMLFLVLLLFAFATKAANIYVIDGGIMPAYLPQLSDRLLKQSCYSASGDSKRYIAADTNNTAFRGYYQYRFASLCQNTRAEQHGNSVSILRTHSLPGALGKGGRPDVPVSVVTHQHQTIIADIIKQNTSSAVKQWHVHNEHLVGLNTSGQADWANYNTLKQIGGVVSTVRALRDIAEGSLSLNGVRVVNLSQLVPESGTAISDRYDWPCDTHPDVLGLEVLKTYAKAVSDLRNRGVIVVAATDNSVVYPTNRGDRLKDNYKMPFPACLSTTVAVGGLSNTRYAQGAIGPGTDFIANYHARNPLTTGSTIGTSYATPKVASNLVELLTINPTKTGNQVLNALRATSDLHSGSRRYGSTTIRYQIRVPNFSRARASIIDSFWKDFIQLINGKADAGAYGWNYGTSNHNNGVLSYFETITLPQQKQHFKSVSANGLTTITRGANTGQTVLRFSFRPYDIDTADELEVLVNDRFYGYVKTTGSNRLGRTQTVCIAGFDLNTNGARNEVKLKVKNSGETWGVRDLKIAVGVADSACLKAPPAFPPLPRNDDRLAGTNQPAGNAYQRTKVNAVPFSFTLGSANGGFPTAATYNTHSVHRDIRVKFTTLSGDIPATDNATVLNVNGSQVLATENYYGANERSYEFIVNRNRLVSGSNHFVFKPRDSSINSVWGIRGISIEYIDPVSLTVGINNASEYGYHQRPRRYTGLRANFTLSAVQNDYAFSVRGWDIDRADETQVFINGVSLGYLDASSGSAYNVGTEFVLLKSVLKTGQNQIELVQRRPAGDWVGTQSEEWAAKDLKVTVLKPDLLPSNVNIVGPKIEVNQPFNVTAVITNAGLGSASPSVVRYYSSVDKVISAADTFMHAQAIGAINPGSSKTLTSEVQSSLVNQGYYMGVCVVAVANEISTSNNCSKGIPMTRQSAFLPALIFLLLDDASND